MKAKKIISTLLMLPMLMVGCTKANEKQSEEIGGTIKVVTSRTDADKLFEKIEEDYNLKLIKDFEKRETEDKVELISLSDFRKELGV